MKYDGYRIHARLEHGRARLLTRTGLDWTDRCKSTAKALSTLPAQAAYLDGELCALRPDGTTTFAELQAATDQGRTGSLVYFVFDLLHLDGTNLMPLPLLERKERLNDLLEHAPLSIRYGDHIRATVRGSSTRHVRRRASSQSALTQPTRPTTAGFGANRNAMGERSSLSLATRSVRVQGRTSVLSCWPTTMTLGKLIYAGRVGTGPSASQLRRVYDKLQPLRVSQMPLERLQLPRGLSVPAQGASSLSRNLASAGVARA